MTKPAMMVWNGCLPGATWFGPGFERERRAAVVEDEAAWPHRGPAAVHAEDAVHERHHVAPPIRGGQVDRAAVGAAGDRRLAGLVRIDPAAQAGRVRLREQLLDRNRPELRVAVLGLQVRVGELLRLDHQVPVHRVRGPELGEVVSQLRRAHLEDVQHLERGKALPGRRQLIDVVAVVVRGHRLHPLGLAFCQVLAGHHAAVRLDLLHDRLGDRALVERVLAFRLDEAQRLGEVGVADDGVERGRVLAVQEDLLGIGVGPQPRERAPDVVVPPLGLAPPSSAMRAARSNVSLNVIVPKRFSSASYPATAPGTVAALTPLPGTASVRASG